MKLLVALALAAGAAAETFAPIAAYVPGSDVTPHARIDLDVYDMIGELASGNWAEAWSLYAEGKNSPKGAGLRTVRGFSKELPDEPAYAEFLAYFGSETYADDYVLGAIYKKLPAELQAELEQPAFFKDADLSDEAVVQMVKKGAVYMNTWIYSLHELYSAVKKCKAGNVDPASGAPHAWDEYWAFYAGTLAGPDGRDAGQLTYALADKRQGNFGTGINNQDPLPTWRSTDDDANSNVNAALLAMTRAGWVNVKNGDCDKAEAKIPLMLAQMTVPLVQGALRYTWKSDPKGNDETFSSEGKALAELNAFGMAIVARVNTCSPEDAAIIAKNVAYPDVLDESKPEEIVPDGFRAVKAAFERNYACMGITCSDVGGLLDGATGEFVEGMEPCSDGSTANDMADLIAQLEEEFKNDAGGGGGSDDDDEVLAECRAPLDACVAKAEADGVVLDDDFFEGDDGEDYYYDGGDDGGGGFETCADVQNSPLFAEECVKPYAADVCEEEYHGFIECIVAADFADSTGKTCSFSCDGGDGGDESDGASALGLGLAISAAAFLL
jgi:hypothetical protein